MNTVDMLKKTLAFTIGAAEFSAERLKQFADEMVSRGEMSSEDAKKFVDDVSKQASDERKSIQDWMRDQTVRMVQQVGAADIARVEKLEHRVSVLEAHVASLMAAPHTVDQGGVCVVDPTTGQCAHETLETQ